MCPSLRWRRWPDRGRGIHGWDRKSESRSCQAVLLRQRRGKPGSPRALSRFGENETALPCPSTEVGVRRGSPVGRLQVDRVGVAVHIIDLVAQQKENQFPDLRK